MNSIACRQCGQQFPPRTGLSKSQNSNRKFCGRECFRASKFSRPVVECQRCRKPFRGKPQSRFCSMECRSTIADCRCEQCGGVYRVKASITRKRRTCSRRCAAILRGVEGRAPLTGKPRDAETRNKVSRGLVAYYGGDPARHPNYKGGPGAARRGGWNRQRDRARARDGNTCVACLRTAAEAGNNIPVHHIRPYRLFDKPAEAHTLDNLVSLCQSCHIKMERGKIFLTRRALQALSVAPA